MLMYASQSYLHFRTAVHRAARPALPPAAATHHVLPLILPVPPASPRLPCPAGTTTRSTLCAARASSRRPTRSRAPCAASSSSSWSAPAQQVGCLAWLGVGVVGASRIGGQVGAVELSCRGAALPPAPSSLPIRRLLLTQSPSPLPAPRRVLRLPAVQGAGPPPAEEQPGGGGDLHPAGPRRGTPRRLHQQGALW